MREIVVVSGKGGTGKTSLTASFAMLASPCVTADCDVDAADLHILLRPEVRERARFRSGWEAVISREDCISCGRCAELCRFGAVVPQPEFAVDPSACEGCGVCAAACRSGAIGMRERDCGEWMISDCRTGIMVHAAMEPGGENSGRLVTRVRTEARRLAEESGIGLVLADGPPGIGCPVIASMTGASLAVAVTEPSVSGAHDLGRLALLAGRLDIPLAVVVNRWDIDPGIASAIEREVKGSGCAVAGRVRYDPSFTGAMMLGQSLIEAGGPAAGDVRETWERIIDIGGV